MAIPIKDHTFRLGIKGKTLERLRTVNIHTLEDLADSSIDTIRDRLSCTKERAIVLINKANRALRQLNVPGNERKRVPEPQRDD